MPPSRPRKPHARAVGRIPVGVADIEAGEDPYQASLIGSKEVSFTIPSMTLSLAAVIDPALAPMAMQVTQDTRRLPPDWLQLLGWR